MTIEKISNKVLEVRCAACKNVQKVYMYSKTELSCEVCTGLLVKPLGSKCKIFGQVVYDKAEL